MDDEFYMDLALREAWKYQLLTYPNPAVGCVIVSAGGEILAVEAHRKAGEAHAELNAVKSALGRLAINLNLNNCANDNSNLNCQSEPNALYEFILKNHADALKGAKAYVTLEPCAHQGKTPPCAKLLAALGFAQVVIGAMDGGESSGGGAGILREAGVKVKTGVLRDECERLIEPWRAWSKGHFAFFKLAMSANGVISGGIISSEVSRAHVHALRARLDLLVVGGETVRTDRPTLDCRLVGANLKAPDVLIYSRGFKFDESIPLFGVKGRHVSVASDLSALAGVKFAMIEGGENFLKALPREVEWLLIYQSPRFIAARGAELNLKFETLHVDKIGEDNVIWAKILRQKSRAFKFEYSNLN